MFDKQYNEPLTGAAILVEGTTIGTTADIDGNYEIKIGPGKYNLIISYVSYNSKKIADVTVSQNLPTIINIVMEEASLELESVQVVGRLKTDTDLSLLRSVRTSLQVVSGISSQQISKTLDRDASEVVKRIPGVTIQDNRFIIVRGLNQRYNNVWLNNAATPSSETDVKAFSFDAIPSNMIDNLLIYKTGTAENAAEATGGFIKITTKNIPDEDFLQVEYGIAYNDVTTFKDAYFLPFRTLDAFALGNIPRALPRDYPANLNDLSNANRDAAALQLSTNWIAQPTMALPNQKLSIVFGKKWNLDEGARLGTLTSVGYSNSFSTRDDMLNYMYERYDEVNNTPIYLYQYIADVYTRDFKIGIMHNWAYQNITGTKIEFKNLLNQIGVDKTANSAGWNNYRNSNFQYYSNQYSARTTYSGQLSGNHKINNTDDHKVDWNVGFAYANRLEPDRQNRSNKEVATGVYEYVLPDVPSINELGRLYMTNHEYVMTAAANWEKKIKIADQSSTLKAGTYHEMKTRSFKERSITYRNAYGNLSTTEINALDFETLFTEPYLGNGKVISADEQTNVANTYTAQNLLSAGYIALVLPIGNFNINSGVRAEYNRLMLQGYYNASSQVNVDNPALNLFPSVNTSYQLNEKNLLRLACSRSINRPEFREVAPLTYYDFTEKNSVVGNPELLHATIQNVDLRFEHYPSPGETFTLAAFYKRFNNPIEMVSIGAGSLFSFDNAKGATNVGVEIELKKSLAFIGLNNFNLNLNAALIQSMVEFEDMESERSRPLQGQSPYVLNAGIYYQNDESGLSSTLMYNVVGKRILVAAQLNQGVVEIPDIYEMPRHVIDFTLNKKLGKQIELKLGIKDILAQDHITQQNFDYLKNEISNTITLVNKLYNTGRTFSVGINWTLK
ncbi:MAG: outer membrane beta-barrel protein [Paludibacter sp.]|nr:outer membrane beta-barrel protein [Paludibacter sp.]